MIYLIPTPIGNLKDISLHALEVLRECEIALCEDTRVSKSLINLLNERFDASINISKFIPLHTHNQEQFFKNLEPSFFDKNVAYISDAGMPGISDPGIEIVRYAQKHDLKYEILSGSNAALLAVVSSGIVSKQFVFLGFLPNTGQERKISIQKVINSSYPCIIYESPKRVLKLVEEIAKTDPQREIFAIKEATKKFETKFKSKAQDLIDTLKNANLNGEWSIVVDKSLHTTEQNITIDDIMSLDISPKAKAKLISKITGEEVKKIYNKIIK